MDERERKRWARVRAGDRRTFNWIVERNMNLVIFMARKFVTPTLDQADLIQVGNLALMQAARKFRPSKGFRFSTFAASYIRFAIMSHINDGERTIRIPRGVYETAARWVRERDAIFAETGKEPTPARVNRDLGYRPRTVRRMKEICAMLQPDAKRSLDFETVANGGGKPTTLLDVLQSTEETVMATLIASESVDQVRAAVASLPPRQALIVRMRFGFDGGEPKTLGAVGRILNISKERVRQVQNDAVDALRKALAPKRRREDKGAS